MTAEPDLLPCPFCGLDVTDDEGCFPLNRERTRWEVRCGNPSCFAHDPCDESMQAAVARWNRRATAAKDAEVEALREEIGRLLDSREREGDRLDWLLARLPGDVIRDLVGEMSCTSDVGEWRDRIDKAARFKPPNP